jgi:hypothetical protein
MEIKAGRCAPWFAVSEWKYGCEAVLIIMDFIGYIDKRFPRRIGITI